MTYFLCSRSHSTMYIIYTPKPQLSLMLPKTLASCNHNMYEVLQTNFMATFYTVAISSVCFEMFETDEQRKMDS